MSRKHQYFSSDSEDEVEDDEAEEVKHVSGVKQRHRGLEVGGEAGEDEELIARRHPSSDTAFTAAAASPSQDRHCEWQCPSDQSGP